MLPDSAKNDSLLNSYFSSDKQRLPNKENLFCFNLKGEAENFGVQQSSKLKVYRGDFNTALGRGHFSRIWTAKDRGALENSFENFVAAENSYSPNAQEVLALKKFWELGYNGEVIKAIDEMAQLVSNGSEKFINWLIDRHTDRAQWSPFVSVTSESKVARNYAPENTLGNYGAMQVYECSIDSNRCIRDKDNIGNASELLVLGWISAEETAPVSSSA